MAQKTRLFDKEHKNMNKKNSFACRFFTFVFQLMVTIYFIGMHTSALADSITTVKSYTTFKTPQPITIKGLPDDESGVSISTAEPFISRDGYFLFFNTGEKENNKDLHFAKNIQGQWLYQGEIGPNVNTHKQVEANPSMDADYNFYYLDTGVDQMIRSGKFDSGMGSLLFLKIFDAVPNRKVKLFSQKFHGNMSVEVSADGQFVFFSRATWNLKGFSMGKLTDSNIYFLEKKAGAYIFDETDSKRIMGNINTSDLEYAASISTDGLELFFTRFAFNDYKKDKIRSKIMHSKRKSLSEPFSRPEMIEVIGADDFVEGPAISGDGKELYYHKHDEKKFRIYKVSRQKQ